MDKIRMEYTEKDITPWGGMVLIKKMLDKIRFSEMIERYEAILRPGSNQGYDVWMLSGNSHVFNNLKSILQDTLEQLQQIYRSRTDAGYRMKDLKYDFSSGGAHLIRDGSHIVLKLSLRLKRCEWFLELWNTPKNFSLPVYF